MRISTTFFIFGLASVVCAAPGPMYARARSVSSDTEALKLRGRDILAIRTTGSSGQNSGSMPGQGGTSSTEKSVGKEEHLIPVVYRSIGAQGPRLTLAEQKKAIATLTKFVKDPKNKEQLPNLKLPQANTIQKFDGKWDTAPGGISKSVSFSFAHEKTCKGNCRMIVDIQTSVVKVLNANGHVVCRGTSGQQSTAQLKAISTQKHNPDGTRGLPPS
ncbi:hypothetical protein J3R30DRAFT_2696439 [Lentinula aciculospora]|uniref:Uncharacterized protein n=1 Tax=Lentinula aciculospora TaxID=153920 RepID=A0A9W9ABN6_9AGAR|nr:hypothetical protein J3R30DRAFT_2696439 [Lentinula aciculospora]